jgi:GAF domain-containing protein
MHTLLQRQLEQSFGSAGAVPAELRNFLGVVNAAYEQAEAEQARLTQALGQTTQQLAERERALSLAREQAEQAGQEKGALLEHQEELVRQRTAALDTLNDVARALSATLSEQSLFEMIADQTRRVMYAENLYVVVFEPATDEIVFVLDVRPGRPRTGRRRKMANGLTEHVIRTRRPFWLHGTSDDIARQSAAAGAEVMGQPTAAWLGVPMLKDDEVLGVMAVEHYSDPQAYDERDVELLQAIASQAAIALKNARLYQLAQEARQVAETLQQANMALTQNLNLDSICERLLDYLQNLVPYDTITIYLLDGGRRLLARTMRGRQRRAGEPQSGFVDLDHHPPMRLVVDSQRSLLIGDTEHYPGDGAAPAAMPPGCWLGVPMLAGGQVIGVCALESEHVCFFTPTHVQLAEGLVAQAAFAIQNAHLFETERSAREQAEGQANQLAALNRVAQTVTSLHDLPSTLHAVAREITEIFAALRCDIALLNAERTELKVVAAYAPPATVLFPADGLWSVTNNLSAVYVIETGRTLIVPNAANNPLTEPMHAQFRARQVESVLFAPLLARGVVTGLISVDRAQRDRLFTPAEATILETIASQMAGAIENARLFSETERRVTELAALTEIGQALSSTLRMDELLQIIYEQVRRVLYAENMYIALYDDSRAELEYAFSRNVDEVAPHTRNRVEEGLTGFIVRHRQSVFLRGDIMAEAKYQFGVEVLGQPAAAWLGVPMMIDERVLGVIVVQHYTDPQAYDPSHQVLLETVANQAAIALENARLFGETQRRVADLAALSDIAKALSSTLNTEALLDLIYEQTRRMMYAENMFIALYDTEQNEVQIVFSRRAPIPVGMRFPATQGLTGYVIQHRSPVLLRGPAEMAAAIAYMGAQLLGDEPAAWLGVPMLIGDRAIGMIANQHFTEPYIYDDSHEALLEAVANQAAIALENARLFGVTQQRLKELATLTDIGQALLSSTLRAETLFQVIYEQTQRVMYAENMLVALYDEERNEVEFAFSHNWAEQRPGTRRSADIGMIGHILRIRRAPR